MDAPAIRASRGDSCALGVPLDNTQRNGPQRRRTRYALIRAARSVFFEAKHSPRGLSGVQCDSLQLLFEDFLLGAELIFFFVPGFANADFIQLIGALP